MPSGSLNYSSPFSEVGQWDFSKEKPPPNAFFQPVTGEIRPSHADVCLTRFSAAMSSQLCGAPPAGIQQKSCKTLKCYTDRNCTKAQDQAGCLVQRHQESRAAKHLWKSCVQSPWRWHQGGWLQKQRGKAESGLLTAWIMTSGCTGVDLEAKTINNDLPASPKTAQWGRTARARGRGFAA